MHLVSCIPFSEFSFLTCTVEFHEAQGHAAWVKRVGCFGDPPLVDCWSTAAFLVFGLVL